MRAAIAKCEYVGKLPRQVEGRDMNHPACGAVVEEYAIFRAGLVICLAKDTEGDARHRGGAGDP